jgi:hypothetical protein
LTKTEAKIQQEIVVWFNNNYCLTTHNPRCAIFSVPNEGKNAREQLYKKALGLKAGVSDLIVVMPGRLVFVEVKDEKGQQSDKQKEFEITVKSLGFEYVVVRSLENFKKIFCN